jgi:hypothetical protein
MLVEVPFKKGDTVSIKLTSGEEIVTRLDEIKEDSYLIHKPLTLMQGPKGLVLGQFMMTADPLANLGLPVKNVMCITKTETGMAKKYIEATTGIQTI